MNKFYITTPIYYVNANPHIGHVYTQVAVDTLSRYHHMIGDEVFFLTGTDEHGEKIEEASIKAGFNKGKEKDFVDTIVPNFKKVWECLDVEYDDFIRTTDPVHEKEVQDFLVKMKETGDIYLGEYDGWFCTPCETFWTKTQVAGGVCPECSRSVDKLKEKNYFFRMSKYQDWLIDYIDKNPEFVMPDFRRNEVLGFLREELTDLCISRPKDRMSWGIEIPFDKDYVVYVWFEALINYLSGPRKNSKLNNLWPADFHIIAKDIIRHHAVFWPIMLKSVGMDLPKTVFAHGWWKIGDEKISKSKGNIVNPIVLREKYGADPVRYFLLRAISFGMDGSFSEDALVSAYNSDLANDLGNLLNRTLTMVEKYFDGLSPNIPADAGDGGVQALRSKDIETAVRGLFPKVNECLLTPKLLLKDALEAILDVVGRANKYIEISAPWEYFRQGNMEAIKLIIGDLLEALKSVSITIFPFLPSTAQKMWSQLGLGTMIDERNPKNFKKELRDELLNRIEQPDSENWRKFPEGIKTAKSDPIFPRIK